jgi:hypothetical protein
MFYITRRATGTLVVAVLFIVVMIKRSAWTGARVESG